MEPFKITNYKISFNNFSPFECAAAEEYFESMSEKGWKVKSISDLFVIFEKMKPEKLNYSVDVFSGISIFDRKDSNAALEYREYCQSAGWDFICQRGSIQVFCSKSNYKTIPIHTDKTEKFKSIFKAYGKLNPY